MPSLWAQSLFLGQIEQKIESILQLLSISCFKKENYLCYETALLTTNTLGQTNERAVSLSVHSTILKFRLLELTW